MDYIEVSQNASNKPKESLKCLNQKGPHHPFVRQSILSIHIDNKKRLSIDSPLNTYPKIPGAWNPKDYIPFRLHQIESNPLVTPISWGKLQPHTIFFHKKLHRISYISLVLTSWIAMKFKCKALANSPFLFLKLPIKALTLKDSIIITIFFTP